MANRKKRPAARGARERPERQQDPRLIAAQVSSSGDGSIIAGEWIVAVSPLNLGDGRQLMWHPPQSVTFNLLQAKRHRDRGVPARKAIMGNLVARQDGGYGPINATATINCLADLVAAVLFSFTAIESLSNHVIDMLPDETSVAIGKRLISGREDLVRWVSVDDKYKRVVPLLQPQCRAIAGDHNIWSQYQALKFIRDELVHVKARGYDPDPEIATAYDRLIVGEGDDCVDRARAVVDGAFPGFIPDWVGEHLDEG